MRGRKSHQPGLHVVDVAPSLPLPFDGDIVAENMEIGIRGAFRVNEDACTSSITRAILLLGAYIMATLEREIAGQPTQILFQSFADRTLVIVTQVGKVGNLVSDSSIL